MSCTASITAGVAVLTYGSTITVDASLADHFRVTLTGNAAIAAPANPTDGQKITFEVIQDAGGSRTLSWNAAFGFGTAGAPTLTTTANKRDLVGFCYSASLGSWMCAGISAGF